MLALLYWKWTRPSKFNMHAVHIRENVCIWILSIVLFPFLLASLTDVRQTLAAPKHQNQEKNQSLAELRSNFHTAIVGHIKTALNNLKVSEAQDISRYFLRPTTYSNTKAVATGAIFCSWYFEIVNKFQNSFVLLLMIVRSHNREKSSKLVAIISISWIFFDELKKLAHL